MKVINSTEFSFNGVKSKDMGVSLVKLETGLTEDVFMAERDINSESIAGNPIPYVYNIEEKPFTVSMVLAKLGDNNIWTLEDRRKIARWLGARKFAEFYSVDDVGKIYFLTYTGGISFYNNGAYQGYLKLEFTSASPYMYSPVINKIIKVNTPAPTIIEIDNAGDTLLFPDNLMIKKIGNGDLSIVNLTDGGREFKFNNLDSDEELVVQNKIRNITSSYPNGARYDNFNKNYLRLVTGINRLEVTGACMLNLQYRYEKLA